MLYTVQGTLLTYERRGDDYEPVTKDLTLLVSAAAGLPAAEVLELALAIVNEPEAEWAEGATVEPESPAAVMRANRAPLLFDEASL